MYAMAIYANSTIKLSKLFIKGTYIEIAFRFSNDWTANQPFYLKERSGENFSLLDEFFKRVLLNGFL
jgi:hypothetical protein